MTLTKEVITDLIIEAIAKNPILGIGIAGDRVLLEGSYSHNIVIEVISNFGIILGILLLSVLGIKWIKSLFSKNESYLDIILIWSSIGFIHLFISSHILLILSFGYLLEYYLTTQKIVIIVKLIVVSMKVEFNNVRSTRS